MARRCGCDAMTKKLHNDWYKTYVRKGSSPSALNNRQDSIRDSNMIS